MRSILAIFIVLSCFITSVYADTYSFTSTDDASRFNTLTKQIRCVVCQHQSIAESSTPIAEGMRRKIYELIVDKKSDSEIKSYLVKRYGEYILLNPRVNSRTLVLWAFPFLALVLAGLILFLLFRKKN